jgi:hypothetical protein
MLNYGNVTIRNSKSLVAVIVIQKVNPMTCGGIDPAWRDKSRYFITLGKVSSPASKSGRVGEKLKERVMRQ